MYTNQFSGQTPSNAAGQQQQQPQQNAAQYAGYAHFYKTNNTTPATQQYLPQPYRQQHQQVVPPPRPGFLLPPPPPRHHTFPPGVNTVPPPRPIPTTGSMPSPYFRPPPPRPTTTATATATAASPWQWSTGQGHGQPQQSTAVTTGVVSAPPVRFNIKKAAAPRPSSSLLSTANAKWPDSLQNYIKRAFGSSQGAADQVLIKNSLQEKINNAIMNNELWTKNWHAEPLPRLVGDTTTPIVAPHKFNYVPVAPSSFTTSSNVFSSSNAGAGAVAASAAAAAAKRISNMLAPSSSPSVSSSSVPTTPGSDFIAFNQVTKKKKKTKKRKPEIENENDANDLKRQNDRRQRFLNDQVGVSRHHTSSTTDQSSQVLTLEGELDLEAMTVKGTCAVVEKEYFRLTSAPHPSTVRPEPVLQKALELVKQKWKERKCDYEYACSQLKSIRQDCTVQRIKNEFTALVYETHARIALESGDINEFNQCQTQLHELYEKAVPGQAIEFLSYRILYCVYVCLQAKSDSNVGMYNVLMTLSDALRQEEAIAHALAVRKAVSMNDYHRFFKLHVSAPNMAGYIMDPMVPTIRLRALRVICKAYRPSVPLDHVRHELRLKGKAGEKFIKESGVILLPTAKGEKKQIDTKNTEVVRVLSTQSSLI